MICKGHARTNGGQLAAYLADYLTHEKNERVEVLEIRGSQFPDLHRSLSAWEAESHRGRTKKPLWHAQISPTPQEFLTREQQVQAVDILEKHLGYQGQPRATVVHRKDGREHIHVVWSRIDRKTGNAKRDDFTHRKNCAAAREMEARFGLSSVKTPAFKSDDKSKSRKERREEARTAPNRNDFQKAARSGIDPRERKRVITECWQTSDTGKTFRLSLDEAGYILAHGNRRDFVVVDKFGDIHSLARQVQGAKADDIRHRLRDVDPASIPKAEHVRAELRAAGRERSDTPLPPRFRRPIPTRPSTPPPAAVPESSVEPPRNPLDPGTILDDLTKHQSTFTKTDLSREVTRRLENAGKPFGNDDVVSLTRAVRHHSDFISLGKDRAERPRYTSRDMLDTELSMRQASDDLATQKRHFVKDEVRDAAPSAEALSGEQRQAFHHVIQPDGISMVVGYAGTGKSTMLGAAREAWEAQGYRVRGASLSSMAAASLQEGSRIPSRTLASTLWQLKNVAALDAKLAGINTLIDNMVVRGDKAKRARAALQAERDRTAAMADRARLTKRDIVVLDEAAMVGSRQMNELLTAVEKAGAKAVLVGDAEQLQAIDAGGAFRALRERHGAVEITAIRRQKDDWQKQASKDFAQSYTDDALGAYRDRGYLHERSSHTEARQEMVDAWEKSRRTYPDKTHLMMAFTRHDVHELNQSARATYRTEGRLSQTDTQIDTAQGKKDFSSGDRIYFLKNDLRLKVLNGSLGTLESIKQSRIDAKLFELTVKLDSGESVTFKTCDYNHFSHGYAATVHKAQGASVDKASVLASQFMDRHSAYVGMSRHREQVDLYYGTDEFGSYRGLVRTLSRDRRKDTTLDYLNRAERQGKPETFWNRVKRLVATPRQEAVDETTRPERQEKPQPETAADRLRRLLNSERPKPRKHDRSRSL